MGSGRFFSTFPACSLSEFDPCYICVLRVFPCIYRAFPCIPRTLLLWVPGRGGFLPTFPAHLFYRAFPVPPHALRTIPRLSPVFRHRLPIGSHCTLRVLGSSTKRTYAGHAFPLRSAIRNLPPPQLSSWCIPSYVPPYSQRSYQYISLLVTPCVPCTLPYACFSPRVLSAFTARFPAFRHHGSFNCFPVN